MSNIDIAPTFVEVAERSPPDYMSGESFLSALSGTDSSREHEPFYESFWGGFPKHPTMFSTRQDQYKYIWYYGPTKDELYNLNIDPLEQQNLFSKKSHKNRRKKIHDRLFDWIEAGGGVPIPLQRDRRGNNKKKRPKNEPKTVPKDLAKEFDEE